MFFVGLVPAIYKEIAVIYKTLANKSTREHNRGMSKCLNGRPYKCLNHRIDPLSTPMILKHLLPRSAPKMQREELR